MGSYISIHNNTPDAFLVKVGPDQAALQIAAIFVSVIAAISTIVTAGAAAGPFVASLVANGVVEVFGITTASLAALTAIASSISGISIASTLTGWAMSMTIFMTKNLQEEGGYIEILPGEKRTFGKYSLSLWRQAECMRVRVNPENLEEVAIDRVMMRPIFSGATNNSTRQHNINYWIEKWGHEGRVSVKASDDSKRAIEAGAQALEEVHGTDRIKVAQEVRLKEKDEELKKAGIGDDGAVEVEAD